MPAVQQDGQQLPQASPQHFWQLSPQHGVAQSAQQSAVADFAADRAALVGVAFAAQQLFTVVAAAQQAAPPSSQQGAPGTQHDAAAVGVDGFALAVQQAEPPSSQQAAPTPQQAGADVVPTWPVASATRPTATSAQPDKAKYFRYIKRPLSSEGKNESRKREP